MLVLLFTSPSSIGNGAYLLKSTRIWQVNMTYFSWYIDADTVVGDVPDHLKEIVACDNSLIEAWINAKKAERVIYFVDYLV